MDYSLNSVRGQRVDVHAIRWREPPPSHLMLVQKHYIALIEHAPIPIAGCVDGRVELIVATNRADQSANGLF